MKSVVRTAVLAAPHSGKTPAVTNLKTNMRVVRIFSLYFGYSHNETTTTTTTRLESDTYTLGGQWILQSWNHGAFGQRVPLKISEMIFQGKEDHRLHVKCSSSRNGATVSRTNASNAVRQRENLKKKLHGIKLDTERFLLNAQNEGNGPRPSLTHFPAYPLLTSNLGWKRAIASIDSQQTDEYLKVNNNMNKQQR